MAKSECRWNSPESVSEWTQWLAAGLHGRNRWRLPMLLVGMLFAGGRRTVTTWLRAAGVSDDYQDYYYFLTCVGRKSESIATRLLTLMLKTLPLSERLLLVIDDSPTRRYGPQVEGADVHHNPTPGPADQPYLYGHIWVTISLALRHPKWGALALPLRAMLYVRQQTMPTIPRCRGWHRFATKLQLAARLVEWVVPLLKKAGKTVWVAVDGGYTKRPFLRRALKTGVTIIGRLRKDAALRDLPPQPKQGERRGRGRPRIYGPNKISLAVYNMNLWMHSLVELWAWNKSRDQLVDRGDSPWDDAERRPSHANRRKALRSQIMREQLFEITKVWSLPQKIIQLAENLMTLAA